MSQKEIIEKQAKFILELQKKIRGLEAALGNVVKKPKVKKTKKKTRK